MNKPIYRVEGTSATPDSRFRTSSVSGTIRNIILLIIIQLCLLAFLTHYVKAQCSMYCNDNVRLSLGTSCAAEVTYRMILEDGDNPMICYPNGYAYYQVIVMGSNNQPIPTSPVVTSNYIGRTLTVKVMHPVSGNSCWGSVTILDGMPPSLQCPPDITIACTESSDTSVTGAPVVSDCSAYTLTYSDQVENMQCQNPASVIRRKWRAKDTYGNIRTCEQLIYIERPELTDVELPEDLDGIDNPALDCDSVAAHPQLTEPANTGVPQINGEDIVNGGQCSIGHTYSDQRLNDCSGGFKILRTWVIADWCSGQVIRHYQVIKVMDSKPPLIQGPSSITFDSYTGLDCSANVVFPPIVVSDNCSDSVFVKIITPYGTVTGNGGTLSRVPIGTHQITYQAKDACGNTSSKPVTVTVRDKAVPVAICRTSTVITLGINGTAEVAAEVFDEGSYDNCCLDNFKIKREHEPDSRFANKIIFTCDDTGGYVSLILRVFDCNGNFNECTIRAKVDEKLSPSITCPPDITLDCSSDYTDLSLTGVATAIDGCGIDTVFYQDLISLDNCNAGTIERTWTATDYSGNSRLCTQIITLENNHSISVTFPATYEVFTCTTPDNLPPDSLPSPYSRPIIHHNSCGLAGVNYEDQVFRTGSTGCFKILRTWAVIDWCRYDGNSSTGYFEQVQTIKVIDNEPPVVQCPDSLFFTLPANACSMNITLPGPTTTDCNQNVQVTASGDLGDGLIFTNVTPGFYDMQYRVSDGCNNESFCNTTIVIIDAQTPTVYCLSSLIVELPPAGETELWAEDIDAGSHDSCSPFNTLNFRIQRLTGSMPFSLPAEEFLTIDCDDFINSPIEVALWVGDQAGNWDYCVTTIEVQDNSGNCGALRPKYSLGGDLKTEAGVTVPNAVVTFSGSIHRMPDTTGMPGAYEFKQVPQGESCFIIPSKTDDLMNGVSTWDIVLIQKHILRTRLLDSPLKLIAADVNKDGNISGLDIIEIRKYILRKEMPFARYPAWCFIPEDYVFNDPANPMDEAFPEKIEIRDLDADHMTMNFHAIKIGDVNATWQPFDPGSVDTRSLKEGLALTIDDKFFGKDEWIEIPVRASSQSHVSGFQFALKFNSEELKIIEIREGILKSGNLTGSFLEEGLLPVSWNGADHKVFNNDILFTLIFRANRQGDLQTTLQLDESILAGEVYIEGDNSPLHKPVLKIEPALAQLEAFQVTAYPNPFIDEVKVEVQLPQKGTIHWQLYDPLGHKLRSDEKEFEKGRSRLLFSEEDFPVSGVYHLVIDSPFGKKNVVLVKG